MLTIEQARFRNPKDSEKYSDDRAFLNNLRNKKVITEEEWYLLTETKPDLDTTVKLTVKDKISLSLFNRVGGFFAAMWESVWDGLAGATAKLWIAAANVIEDPYKNFLTRFVTAKVLTDEAIRFMPPGTREAAERFKKDPNVVDAFRIEIYGLVFILGGLISLIPIIGADAKRQLNKEFSPNLPDISSLIKYGFRYPNELTVAYEKAGEQGFEKSEFELMTAANRPILEIGFIKDLYLRKKIDTVQAIKALEDMGYSKDIALQIVELFYYIPSPPDQVRFAVREAFYPEYVEKYGLDAEYPQQFENDVGTVGVSPKWAKMYWRSHWELPSIQMGFEMLHRGVITEETLDDLFKAADIMPYWRQALKEISYNPLTRVDVRRMQKIGVLDREGVYAAYKATGYNNKNAELMTEFTLLYNQGSERDLTKSDILNAYKRRMIDVEQAKEFLLAMRYDADEIAIMIGRIDYDLAQTKKKVVLANLKKQYLRGGYSSQKVHERAGELDVNSNEIAELLELWDIEKKDDSRSLTRGDLDKLGKAGVIDENRYREEMGLLKYGVDEIELLSKLVFGEED